MMDEQGADLTHGGVPLAPPLPVEPLPLAKDPVIARFDALEERIQALITLVGTSHQETLVHNRQASDDVVNALRTIDGTLRVLIDKLRSLSIMAERALPTRETGLAEPVQAALDDLREHFELLAGPRSDIQAVREDIRQLSDATLAEVREIASALRVALAALMPPDPEPG
jgi:hypothetical protein